MFMYNIHCIYTVQVIKYNILFLCHSIFMKNELTFNFEIILIVTKTIVEKTISDFSFNKWKLRARLFEKTKKNYLEMSKNAKQKSCVWTFRVWYNIKTTRLIIVWKIAKKKKKMKKSSTLGSRFFFRLSKMRRVKTEPPTTSATAPEKDYNTHNTIAIIIYSCCCCCFPPLAVPRYKTHIRSTKTQVCTKLQCY